MRQIEILRYSCPQCNADLAVQAVDFSYDSTNGEATKTSYRCIGCLEEFYSIEEAYVSEPDKTPEYICPFCHDKCVYLSLKDDWTDYWKCLSCKVSYCQSLNPSWKGIEMTNMYTTLNSRMYVLRQFLNENRSRIDMLPEDEEDTIVIAKDFDFLFPNITPSNIQQKLLTYLVFS
jgi:DNA-directed RNA polymerase subunit RPC12/RpoP